MKKAIVDDVDSTPSTKSQKKDRN